MPLGVGITQCPRSSPSHAHAEMPTETASIARCVDCDGKPSYAQMDAARAGAEVHEVKTLESIT